MVVGTAAASASASASATTATAHHRKTNTKPISSSLSKATASLYSNSSVSGSNQPIVVLYFSSGNDVVAAGYDNSPQPLHLSYLPIQTNDHVQTEKSKSSSVTSVTTTNLRNMHDAEDIFQYYSSTIERLVHLCGGGSILSPTATTSSNMNSHHNQNRFVVLHNYGLYINRYWKIAITRILQDICNATMISFLSTIHMIPFSIVSPPEIGTSPPLSSSSSSASHEQNATTLLLSIHITTTEAQCMVYANGHHLEYTYQSCGYDDDDNDDNDDDVVPHSIENTVMVDDIRKKQEMWLRNCESSSLVRAILLCVLKCPSLIRLYAIQNLFFSGTILVHNFQERVAFLLYQFLQTDIHKDDNNDSSTTSPETSIDQLASSPSDPNPIQYTQIPINRSALFPLAKYIAIVHHPCCYYNCGPADDTDNIDDNKRTMSTELIPWYGTSVYVSYWKFYEHETGIVPMKEMNWTNVATNSPWDIFKD